MSPACSTVCPGFCSCFYSYHLITEPKTWFEAQGYCRKKYSDLASVDNVEDMGRLLSAADRGYEGKAWIGLHNLNNSWQWAFKEKDFYEQDEWNFRSWQEGQPNDTTGFGKLCVFFHQGFWYDDDCTELYRFVCYQKWSPDVGTGQYFFIDQEMTWDDALAYCRKFHTDLASVKHEYGNNLIKVAARGRRFWIGLYRHMWSWWSDGSDHAFRYWEDGHPENLTERCAASVINATQLGKWVENDCKEKLHFVCQNNKRKLFNVQLKTLKTTVDLNVPAVTDAILNQIKKKLMKEGITSDIKIFWIKLGENIFHKEKENADAVEVNL
ncbi:hypothetical protein FQN60_006346 [Etheostoma spectabile]|uniref:C-type lectin domain-containing protein n=1 Tax=Etheostoma spectabile TaxID=54343 RepID=A0A5J5CPR2_9PERO|nr:hypothetical protein FQN60_006346 [Etheostoma spectabile]